MEAGKDAERRAMGQESTEEIFWYSDRARKDKTMFAEIPQSAWRQFRHPAFQKKSYSRRRAEEAAGPYKSAG